jgi:hypothetical protein
MGTIKDFKYKVCKNFLDNSEIELLKNYCRIRHRVNFDNFDMEQSDNADTFFYADPLMESLMLKKHTLMEKETGLSLHPTYAFWRMYTKFSDLKKHKDRPSCEISVTVMIDSDKTEWPIYIEGNKIILQPGDAAIYLGCELLHWRDEFLGDFHAQSFLHYVDKNGPYEDFKIDKRDLFGLNKPL